MNYIYPRTIVKSLIINIYHILGYINRSKTFTIIKCVFSNRCDILWDINRIKLKTLPKSRTSY